MVVNTFISRRTCCARTIRLRSVGRSEKVANLFHPLRPKRCVFSIFPSIHVCVQYVRWEWTTLSNMSGLDSFGWGGLETMWKSSCFYCPSVTVWRPVVLTTSSALLFGVFFLMDFQCRRSSWPFDTFRTWHKREKGGDFNASIRLQLGFLECHVPLKTKHKEKWRFWNLSLVSYLNHLFIPTTIFIDFISFPN